MTLLQTSISYMEGNFSNLPRDDTQFKVPCCKIIRQWKQGLIHEFPLYKGGSTPKNKCDIYGSVPLMPSLLKTFSEKILCPAYLNF